MKKILFIMIMMFAVLGCEDKSYRGELDDLLNSNTQLPVSILLGDSNGGMLTKGSGPMDDPDRDVWKNSSIYVYAFRRGTSCSYAVTSAQDMGQCLIDASRESGRNLGGKQAEVVEGDLFLKWKSSLNNTIYYPIGNIPYDFFAYYVDDIPVKSSDIRRYDDRIVLKLKIDGTQDLMTAKAELTDKQLEPFQTESKKKELENIHRFSYSSYTAARNVQPVLNFRHHLTKLDFELHSSRTGADKFFVDSLIVFSKNQLHFTVAGKDESQCGADFSDTDDYVSFRLREPDGSVLRPGYYHPPVFEAGSDQGNRIGGSMMVAPDVKYKAIIYMTGYKDGHKMSGQYPLFLNYKPDGGFGAGHEYLIKLRVNGFMQIDVSVEVGEWTSGGKIELDPEVVPGI